jgi:hypothetical protein
MSFIGSEDAVIFLAGRQRDVEHISKPVQPQKEFPPVPGTKTHQ